MQSIYPVLKYADAHAAIDFLERAFGFERLQVHAGESGVVVHAELRFGEAVVMLSSAGARDPEGNIWSFGTYRPELDG